MDQRYDLDVLSGASHRRRAVPVVAAERDLVVEDAESGFCGAVVGFDTGAVVLEDRGGRRRNFPLRPASFLLEGQLVTLRRPGGADRRTTPARTASGSVWAPAPTRVATASRIWVEGRHDAELVERVWGDDLRHAAVVVEPLDGIDGLAAAVAGFGPGPGRRLGILVDHLVAGSKETRCSDMIGSSDVLITGHPYVDIWQAVRPERVGMAAWPLVPRGRPWKEGVCAALGETDPASCWRRILGSVRTFRDLEPSLVGAVERLIDFVTEPRSVPDRQGGGASR